MQGRLFLMAFPLLVLAAAGEGWLYKRLGRPGYAWKESLASFGVALGHRFSGALLGGAVLAGFGWLWAHRLFTVPLRSWWGLGLLFLAEEFAYYWEHRLSHEVRWLWASHAVHHTPRHLNLSSAYRLGWTGLFSGLALFFAPLVWLGFDPRALGLMLGLNLLYQFWLHTELLPALGRFDRIFNSPANHRVHHAVNVDYLDRNYGGVLILFDRLFGTYQAERAEEPCRYGLVEPLDSHNPFVIAFHVWGGIFQDLRRARSWREVLGYAFGRPGWRPDGSGRTTEELRRAQAA